MTFQPSDSELAISARMLTHSAIKGAYVKSHADISIPSRFFEVANLLVRFNQLARCIENANHRIM
jgi:hypothetical protein